MIFHPTSLGTFSEENHKKVLSCNLFFLFLYPIQAVELGAQPTYSHYNWTASFCNEIFFMFLQKNLKEYSLHCATYELLFRVRNMFGNVDLNSLWKAVDVYLWWKSVKNWQANNWSHACFSLGVWWSTYFFHRLKYNFSLLHVKWQKKQQYLLLSRLDSDQGCLGYNLASETQTLGTSLIELKLWHWKKSDLPLSLFIVALSIIIPDYTAPI